VREPREYENPLCAEVSGNFWFPDTQADINAVQDAIAAKSICHRCSHRTECAEWGIRKEHYGIWGGLTLRERQVIRRQKGIRIHQEEEDA
jgi:hypothetical protein